MLKHLGIDKPLAPFRKQKPRNSNYYDDRILDILDTDVRYIWSGFTDLGGARMDSDCKDAWGITWKQVGSTITSIDAPLKGMQPEEIERYSWPDPYEYFDFELIENRIGILKEKYPDRAIAARAVNSYGPFEQAAELRGREDFYMDMIADKETASLIVDKCTDVIVRAQEIYLDKVGDILDFFEIPGDDYGSTSDLMISPDIFEDLFKPALKKIVDSVKSYRKDLPVAFHSDGAISKIIDSLVEIGIDILNPLEPLEATDWRAVKQKYSDSLCFMGGVDLKKALRGSPEDVARDVLRCIDTFADGGGYILTSANHMPPDIPPENIVKMFEEAKTIGIY
jgi:uroporphyrinogen decarboxylase